MSNITAWSPVDEDLPNKAAPPDGFPEPMLAGKVNDSARAVMGSVRRNAEEGGWFDWGHTVAYISADSVNVDPGYSHVYTVGRRVKFIQNPSPTVYGSILSYDNTSGVLVATLDSGAITSQVGIPGGTPLPGRNGVSVGTEVSVTPTSAPTPEFPPGAIVMYGAAGVGTTGAPDGWLWCSGDAYSSTGDTSLAPLFDVIGTTFGGNGPSNFNVPDMRARVPAGYSNDTTVLSHPPANAMGAKGGAEESELHGHAWRANDSDDQSNGGYAGSFQTRDLNATHKTEGPFTGTPTNAEGEQIGGAGSAVGSGNVQPTIIVNYIIKK